MLIKKIQNCTIRERFPDHVAYFKFWDPQISLERLKVENSNFASALLVRHTKQKCKKGQKGAYDLLLNFATPYISKTAEVTNLIFCMRIEVRDTKPNKN